MKLSPSGGSKSHERASASVLAIVPQASGKALLEDVARRHQWKLTVANAMEEALVRVANESFSLILLDRDMAGGDWRGWVRRFAELRSTPSVILISSVGGHYLFDELVKQGGFDVIAKPLEADELDRIARLAFSFWKRRAGKSTNG